MKQAFPVLYWRVFIYSSHLTLLKTQPASQKEAPMISMTGGSKAYEKE